MVMMVSGGGGGTPVRPPPRPPLKPSAPPVKQVSAQRPAGASSAPSTPARTDTSFDDIRTITAAKEAAARARLQASQAEAKAAAKGLQQNVAQTKQVLQRYARTLPAQSTMAPTDTALRAKAQAEKSSFKLLMASYLVQQGVHDPTKAAYTAEEEALLHDPGALAKLESQVEQSVKGAGLSHSALQSLVHGGEVAAGEQLLPTTQQTSAAIHAYGAAKKGGSSPSKPTRDLQHVKATTALQRAGFLEEVM